MPWNVVCFRFRSLYVFLGSVYMVLFVNCRFCDTLSIFLETKHNVSGHKLIPEYRVTHVSPAKSKVVVVSAYF